MDPKYTPYQQTPSQMPEVPNTVEPLPESPEPSVRDKIKGWLGTALLLLAAPLAALVLTAFVFQTYEVDGPSMESTLHHSDRLIVLKLGRTWSRITRKPYIPKRGEIIIFVRHNYSGYEEDKQLIKRVIALPGERIVIKDGKVLVYNQQFPDGFEPDRLMPYGKDIGKTTGNVDLTVPEGEVFAMGDNRNNSFDSRDFGTIPGKDIVGELVLRLFPLNQIDKF